MMQENNQMFIDAYKNDDKIITDYYKLYQNGKKLELTGIINPLTIDNRQIVSPVDQQSWTSHCAGYSAATLVESIYWKQTGKLLQLDSHQVYALAKQLDGDKYALGTYLEAALNAVLKLCKNDDRFKFLDNAKISTFYNDKTNATIENTKYLLHRYDFLQVGFNIDEGWNDCTNINYVLKARGRNLGGHAVILCGADKDGFYVCNQWGSGINGQLGWGAKGFAVMPYQLFLQQFMYGAYINNYNV